MEKLIDEIVSADNCIDGSEEFVALSGVTFKKDFGPWKQGDKVEGLTFQWDQKRVVEQDENGGDVVDGKSCSLIISPVTA